MQNLYALDAFELIYASAAVFGAWGLGILLGISGSAERIFVGLGVVAAISVPLLITQPGSIRWVALGFLSLGVLRASISIARRLVHAPLVTTLNLKFTNVSTSAESLASKIWTPRVFETLGTLLLSFILTAWLFPIFFIFESHDLLYFGWLPSLFTGSDLAVNFAVPMHMGATNSMPSLFLVPLANPLASPDFLDFIALRAWVVLLFTFLILRRMLHFSTDTGSRGFRLATALGLVLLIWGGEWAYAMMISSFVPAIGLALITLSILSGSKRPTTIFILFSLVAIAKAPIIAVSLLTLGFLAYSKSWRPDPLTFIQSAVIIFGSVVTWILSPKGTSSSDTAFSLMGLGYKHDETGFEVSLRLFDWAASFTGLTGWIVDYPMSFLYSTMFSGTRILLVSATAFSIIWLLSKYFFSFLFLRRKLFGADYSTLGPLDVWAAGALFSILFVRNGESLSLGHQAHSFILMSVPISILAAYYLLTQKTKIIATKQNLGAVALVATVCALGVVSASSPMVSRGSSYGAVSLSQALEEYSEMELSGGVIDPDPIQYSRLQVIAAITNSKLLYMQDASPPSQVDRFLVHPK